MNATLFSPFTTSVPPTPTPEPAAGGKKARKAKPNKGEALPQKPKRKWTRRAIKDSPAPLSSLPTQTDATAEMLDYGKLGRILTSLSESERAVLRKMLA